MEKPGRNNKSQKAIFLNLVYLFGCILLFSAMPDTSMAKRDIRDSMVKIYSVQNSPDYNNPWNMAGPEPVSGSGCIIEGNRILTNAHVISDQTFIQVRLHGHSKKSAPPP